jgi:N-acyl-phosphatidylethanolamine-hydrolysing phospholipase D
MHVDPEEAVQIHVDVRCKQSIGIHWGTFALGAEHYMEPVSMLAKAVDKFCLERRDFFTANHGKILEF